MWKLAPLVLIALLTAACQSGSPVATDYDTATDFGAFHRYAWLDERSGADKDFDPLLGQRVRDAVSDGLGARQFTAADSPAHADFLVRYYIKADDRTEQPKATGGIGIGGYGGNVGVGVGLNFPIGGSVTEQRAQILIDFINAKDRKLAWRGSRTITLRGDDPNAVTGQIRSAVDAILGQFPPR